MSTLSAIAAAASAGIASAPGQAAARTAFLTASLPPQPRLVKAAHEFEAQMMKELLEPLNHSSSLLGSDGDDDSGLSSGDSSGGISGSTGALGEFASEALGEALSEGGGFGIATGIVKQLSRTETRPQNNGRNHAG